MNNIATIPNFISFLRFIGGILFIPLDKIFHFSNTAIIIIIFGAWFSDLVDGWAARKLNQISDSGKLIDPIADKVFIFALIITFLLSGKVGLFYFTAVIGRDILILLGGLIVKKMTGTVLPSNLFGKIAVFSIGIYFLTVLFKISALAGIIMWVSSALIFLSLVVYFLRAAEFVKDHNYVQ